MKTSNNLKDKSCNGKILLSIKFLYMFTFTYDIIIIYESKVKLYILQIADLLQYPNSTKWLHQDISGVVTQNH